MSFLANEGGFQGEGRGDLDAAMRHAFSSTSFDLRNAQSGEVQLPSRIEGYRIIRHLGRGGMAVVYEAEEDHPRRRVAIKVLGSPVVGQASARRRFEREATTLAQLSHPAIAQVYASGVWTSPSGDALPYFSMELVPGALPLTRYAARHGLSSSARIELFIRALVGVQHGHDQGVVHRDLKPANLLVDEQGNPKVIDFGIALATDADLTRVSHHTQTGQLLGTPLYMSPEQFRGERERIDARSDVYALGVVLFEMLTGRLPFEWSGGSVVDLAQVITHEEPLRLTAIDPTFREDLDTILSKAQDKDSERRYANARELADDLRRFLDDEPISARPPTRLYQLRKFAVRNRALVGGVAGIIVALALGLVASLVLYFDSEVARAQADRQARKALAIREFVLDDMLSAATPSESGRDARIAELLIVAANRVGTVFENEPEFEGAIRLTLGTSLERLGLTEEAGPQLKRAYELHCESLGEEAPETLVARTHLGSYYVHQNDFAKARAELTASLEAQRRLLGEDDPATRETKRRIAQLNTQTGDLEAAESLLRELVASSEDGGFSDTPGLEANLDLAEVLVFDGRIDEALELLVRIQEAAAGNSAVDELVALSAEASLAQVNFQRADFEAAEASYRAVLDKTRELFGKDHPNSAGVLVGLGSTLSLAGKLDEAETTLRDGWALYREKRGDRHRNTLTAAHMVANVLRKRKMFTEAEALLRETLDIRRDALGDEDYDVAQSLEALGLLFQNRGEYDAALAAYREALAIYELQGEDSAWVAQVLVNLIEPFRLQNRHGEARPYIARALEIDRKRFGDDSWQVAVDRIMLAEALYALERFEETIEQMEQVRALYPSLPNLVPWRLTIAETLARPLTRLGRFEEAEQVLLPLHDELAAAQGLRGSETRRIAVALVELYQDWNRPDDAARFARQPTED